MAGGDVFITGRVKDIIIRAGRNIYPHEIEEAVGEIPGIRKGGVAVFGIARSATRHRAADRAGGDPGDRRRRRAQALLARAHEVAATHPRRAGRRDRAGRRRARCRRRRAARCAAAPAKELYEQRPARREAERPCGCRSCASRSPGRGPSSRASAARSAIGSMPPGGGWCWRSACALGWLAVMVLPRLSHGAGRRCARIARVVLLAHSASRSTTKGLERLPHGGAVLAVQPLELYGCAGARRGAAGRAGLRRQDRNSPSRSSPARSCAGSARCSSSASTWRGELADAEAVDRRSRAREALIVFFPEGTFTRRPGLSGFYLGAFKVAAEAGLAGHPRQSCAARGRCCAATNGFRAGAPIASTSPSRSRRPGTDFTSVLRLRDARARRHAGALRRARPRRADQAAGAGVRVGKPAM